MENSQSLKSHPFFTLGQSVGLSAFIWGYPLIETIRTCRMITGGAVGPKLAGQFPMETLRHKQAVNTSEDRTVVASATDILYGTAWLNLANGPRVITVPSSAKHKGRYFVMAMYDAWTNNFDNPRTSTTPSEGESFVLLGPGTPKGAAVPANLRVVHAPTDLIWMIPRVVVDDPKNLEPVLALQADMQVHCPSDTHAGRLPLAVTGWVGNLTNSMDDLIARPDAAAEIAQNFFTNLSHALVDTPAPSDQQGLVAWFKTARLVPDPHFSWSALPKPIQEGLQRGMADAVALIQAAVASDANAPNKKPWDIKHDLGRYGNDFFLRAIVAWRGLAANASEVSLYGACHNDTSGEPLDGRHRYTLRFPPDGLPPAGEFWSITLYNKDRFFYPNRLERFSLGNLDKNLQHDPDGGITMLFCHEDQGDNPNWVPAPAGPFYLQLRLYEPRQETNDWQGPLPVRGTAK
ncbi:MAG: DUF1254 domain-containing protein [Betaproteobacteria bacterium]|nr:DUF1254 domain-containing protein [Betaproteobacteria bacterium]